MSGKSLLRASAVLFGPAAFLLLAFVPTTGRTQDKQAAPGAGSRALPNFTGYTRPGYPNDLVNREGKIVPAGYEKVGTWVLGSTIYFTVLERTSGVAGDSFGTAVKDFNHSFVRGVSEWGEDSSDLDTTARYLYLYQTINDRTLENAEKTEKDVVPITGTTVRLIVDPSRITSWGHFTGIGFQAHFKAPKKGAEPVKGAAAVKEEAAVILPVSAVNFLVPRTQTPGTRMYLRQSPAYRSTQLFTLARITADQEAKAIKESGIKPVAFGDAVVKKALEPTQDPDRVLLLKATSTASRKAIWPFADSVRARSAAAADGDTAELDDGDGMVSDKEVVAVASTGRRTTRGAVRAIWSARRPLPPFARGSVFGFTCNLPPVFDGVNLRPLTAWRGGAAERVPIIPAASDGVVAAAVASGTVPAMGVVPTPIDRAPAAEGGGFFSAFGLNTLSTLGGLTPGGFGGGLGGTAGGAGFAPAGGGFGGGAGAGGGSGGNNGNNVPLSSAQQEQQQQQQQQQPTTPASLTQTVSVNVNNNANASASANANASASANATASATATSSSSSSIVPAPPALILAAMGLPALWLLYQRRKGMNKPAVI